LSSGNTVLADSRRATTRREILVHARGLFAVKGIETTTMGDIAEALGITRATLYKYFPGKEELVRDAIASSLEIMGAMFPGTDATSMQHGLTLLARRHADVVLSRGANEIRFFYRFLLDQLGSDLEAEVLEQVETFREAALKLLEIGLKNGELRPGVNLEAAVDDLTAEIVGLDVLWLLMPERIDLPVAAERFIERFLMQIGSESRSGTRR
jgi:AcrR family transcriptional regulator